MNNPKKKITILEDDADIMEICTYFFMSEGYQVNCYQSVREFNAAPITSTDLFLLDVRLPDGNGLDVCKLLKNDHQYDGIPIIMMSAHMDTKVMMHQCQADRFISKPFDLDSLLENVQMLIA